MTPAVTQTGMYREYENFRQQDGLLPVTYEVIYGHGWKKVKPLNLKNVKQDY